MVLRRCIRGSICLALLGCLPLLRAQNALPLLTKAVEVKSLPPREAGRSYPVQIEGVVTFFERGIVKILVVQDETAGIAIFNHLDLPLKPGHRVRVTGRSEPGGYAPVVRCQELVLLGEAPLPDPIPITYDQLATGLYDGSWVELSGVVRAAAKDRQVDYLALEIATTGGRLSLLVQEWSRIPAELVDAEVRVQGVAIPFFTGRRQLYNMRVLVPSMEQVRVGLPAPAAPEEIPTVGLSQLFQYNSKVRFGHRVRVVGTVTAQSGSEVLFIEEKGEGLRVHTRQETRVVPGDRVEVVGFPALGTYNPILEDASFRVVASGTVAPPALITPEKALTGDFDSELVEIEARLLDRVRRGRDQVLVLQSGKTVFNAHLPEPDHLDSLQEMKNGTLLRLTGICQVEVGEIRGVYRSIDSFHLLLRSAGDLRVLQEPSWWTLKKLLWVVGALVSVLVVGVGWLWILRRKVRQQTRFIRAQLEHEARLKERYHDLFENANDVVYTHDPEGYFTSINTTGEEITSYERADIMKLNFAELVVPEQRDQARDWLRQLARGERPPVTEWKITTRKGTMLLVEVSARPILHQGRCIEVEGIARDVTERRRLEREILEISGREQRRIGHDLHDGLCQHLAGIAFLSQILEERLEEKQLEEGREARKISTLLQEAIGQTRSLARGLFPVRLEENGLASALQELCDGTEKLFQVNCRFETPADLPIRNNAAAEHLYFIAHEAMMNAVKHGQAEKIHLALHQKGPLILLEVRDDGVGFSLGASIGSGMGLRIMHYRARMIGGTLEIRPGEPAGTVVLCCVPSIGLLQSPSGNATVRAESH